MIKREKEGWKTFQRISTLVQITVAVILIELSNWINYRRKLAVLWGSKVAKRKKHFAVKQTISSVNLSSNVNIVFSLCEAIAVALFYNYNRITKAKVRSYSPLLFPFPSCYNTNNMAEYQKEKYILQKMTYQVCKLQRERLIVRLLRSYLIMI